MDLVAGHIFFSAQTVSSTAQVRGGALNAIVHTHASRLPDFQDVPTFREMGIDLVATTWFAISGPARLPDDIVQKMNREIIVPCRNRKCSNGCGTTAWWSRRCRSSN